MVSERSQERKLKNKAFIEIIQFQCLPNFLNYSEGKRYIKSFYEFAKVLAAYGFGPLEYSIHFEYVTLNECYLRNMDKYEYIIINDQDESVIPRRIVNLLKIDNTKLNFELNQTAELFENNYQCADDLKDLKNYMNYLKNVLNEKNETIAFHFMMGMYLPQFFVVSFFKELSKTLNNHSKNFDKTQFDVDYVKGLKFKIVIHEKIDFEYAKYLEKLYLTVIQPFMLRNTATLELMPDQFNRIFLFHGKSTSWYAGKTIHNTQITTSLTTHYPDNKTNILYIPMEYGYLSHFREDLEWMAQHIPNKLISIRDFKFDINYFQCYYKPLTQKLGYKIQF